MFSSAFLFPANDPLAGIISHANASQLEALAGFFEAQARALRNAAYEVQRKERAAVATQERREKAKADWVKIGARAHVLKTRGLEWPQIALRLLVHHDVARAACGKWRKEKSQRARARRDVEIFRLVVQNVERSEIAKRYGISARQVRSIANAVSHRLTQARP